ncbi:MAG: hypothetical protein RLZZ44_1804 [Bacteroidota bacterium]|jgi:O-antigen/teichoic acid export membrane protein
MLILRNKKIINSFLRFYDNKISVLLTKNLSYASGILTSFLNAVILWPLILKKFGPVSSAYIILVMTLASLISPILCFGSNATLTNIVKNSSRNQKLSYLNFSQIISCMGVIVSSLLWLKTNRFLEILALGLALSSVACLQSILRGLEDVLRYSLLTLTGQTIIPLFVLQFLTDFESSRFIQVQAILISTTSYLLSIYNKNFFLKKPENLLILIKKSLPFAPYIIETLLLLNIGKLGIAIFFSPRDVSEFQIPSVIGGGVLTATFLILPVIFHSFYVTNSTEMHNRFAKTKNISRRILLFSPLLLFVYPVTYWLTPLDFSPSKSALTSLILSTCALLIVISEPYQVLFILEEKGFYLFLSSSIAIVSAVIAIKFLPFDAQINASLSSILGYGVRFICIRFLFIYSNYVKSEEKND